MQTSNTFLARDWNVASREVAVSANKYFQFEVGPKDNFKLAMSEINATLRRSQYGPTWFQFQYSLDKFKTPGIFIDQPVNFPAEDFPANGRMYTIPLSQIPALQSVQAGTTVTFRLYAWAAPQVGGSFGFVSPTIASGFDLTVTGQISTLTNPTYVWNPAPGTVVASWDIPSNWVPNRNTPTAADILVFDRGDSTMVTNVPTQTLGQVIVENNTNVSLVPSSSGGEDPSTSTLTLNGVDGLGLSVQQNSTLRFWADGPNKSLVLQVPSTSAALIGGTVVFGGQSSSGVSHRLLASSPEAIIFLSGATFFAQNFSGNPFGSSGAPNTVLFRGGSTYLARNGANPFALSQPSSKVVFARRSIYRLEQTSGTSFAGRTYGDLIIDLSRTTGQKIITVNAGSSTSNPMIVDNLTLLNGTVNFPLNFVEAPLHIHLRGSLLVGAGAAFNFSPNTASAASTLTFMGTEPQAVSGFGSLSFGAFSTFQVNTPSLLTLERPLSLDGTLQLSQGVLFTGTTVLTVNPGGRVIGGNSSSFVDGPLAQGVTSTASTTFIFPMGNKDFVAGGQAYRPLVLTVAMATATPTFFTVRQFEQPPLERDLPPTLDGVSNQRHFNIVKEPGGSTVLSGTVTLTYGEDDGVEDLDNLSIASSNAEEVWNDLGGTAAPEDPGSARGTITAPLGDNPFFGDFVLANATGGQNPLPVELISFRGNWDQNGVVLNWSTASEKENKGFEVQRSPDATEWENVGFVPGHGNSHTVRTYRYSDQTAPIGTTLYYRLQQADLDGTYAYSPIVAVETGGLLAEITVYPNPVIDELHLRLAQPSQQLHLRIVNLLGQTVLEKRYANATGGMVENVSSLPAGTYQLDIISDKGRLSRKFVKTSR